MKETKLKIIVLLIFLLPFTASIGQIKGLNGTKTTDTSNPASNQNTPGIRDSLYSNVLKEKRFVNVVLPKDYKADLKDRYDVLYILDGEGPTKLFTPIQQLMEQEGFVPRTILVGISNVDRARDFLPTKVESYTTSGGANNFLSFFKEDLIPFINKNYPSSGKNNLYGHSWGGVFSMYAFLKEPSLFESYLVCDPSFWWDNKHMNKLASDMLTKLPVSGKTIHISGREGRSYEGMGIANMDTIFQVKAPEGLYWKFVAYPEETHMSVRLKSFYDGMKYTYKGFNQKEGPVFHPTNGTILENKPIKVWCFVDDLSSLRYTTDGSIPTTRSKKMEREITLTGPAKLKVKPVTYRVGDEVLSTGTFKAGKIFTALQKVKNIKPGGLKYSYYEGVWDSLPDFTKLRPVKKGYFSKEFWINDFPLKKNFACVLEGYIEIKQEGYYILGLDSDDGSRLFLNNELLVNHDGIHGTDGGKSYNAPLEKGFYPIRIEYFQKDGGSGLKLMYITPDSMEPQPIPFELQYSKQ